MGNFQLKNAFKLNTNVGFSQKTLWVDWKRYNVFGFEFFDIDSNNQSIILLLSNVVQVNFLLIRYTYEKNQVLDVKLINATDKLANIALSKTLWNQNNNRINFITRNIFVRSTYHLNDEHSCKYVMWKKIKHLCFTNWTCSFFFFPL